ncbi:hypothetical protein F2Q68_00004350 [Brassica cretica]|uniref:Uncharacterized protein n=1 Tax=Brassica cretica TaxID=69181 RepID=A0A8S9JEJ6_BRACR|nr:hypothetical protein F2Q68_00004350 [Brassica cretica]
MVDHRHLSHSPSSSLTTTGHLQISNKMWRTRSVRCLKRDNVDGSGAEMKEEEEDAARWMGRACGDDDASDPKKLWCEDGRS